MVIEKSRSTVFTEDQQTIKGQAEQIERLKDRIRELECELFHLRDKEN
jgi:hypothetical protein